MRLRDRDFYAALARTVRRNEVLDTQELIEHLNLVGYSRADLVEMCWRARYLRPMPPALTVFSFYICR